jgi:hypothetical protein
MMKKLLEITMMAAFVLTSAVAHGQSLPDRRLPEFLLNGDLGDEILTQRTLEQPYVLLILDLKNQTSLDLLQMLSSSKLDEQKIYAAVMFPDGGTGGKHQQREMDRLKPLLPQARWFRGNGFEVLKTLKLAGTPAVLGIDPQSQQATGQHTVVWRVIGLPAPADRLGQQVRAWISPPPVPQTTQ